MSDNKANNSPDSNAEKGAEKKVPTRPLPKLTELDTAEFWQGTAAKEFRY